MNRHPFLKTHHKTLMSAVSLAALPPDAGAIPPAAPRERSHQPSAALQPPPRRWNSTELLADGPLAEIAHGDQVYRLRLTALGKLILTK